MDGNDDDFTFRFKVMLLIYEMRCSQCSFGNVWPHKITNNTNHIRPLFISNVIIDDGQHGGQPHITWGWGLGVGSNPQPFLNPS